MQDNYKQKLAEIKIHVRIIRSRIILTMYKTKYSILKLGGEVITFEKRHKFLKEPNNAMSKIKYWMDGLKNILDIDEEGIKQKSKSAEKFQNEAQRNKRMENSKQQVRD